MQTDTYERWYWNEDKSRRDKILWEMHPEIRPRSTDWVLYKEGLADGGTEFVRNAHRFYSLGNFGFFLGQIYKRFVEEKLKSWHFFHSIALLRACNPDGTKADMNLDFFKLIYGFDVIIDIDSKKNTLKERMEESHTEAAKIVDYLKKMDVPFIINASGSSGFHLRILWSDLRQYFKPEEYGTANRELALFIVKESGAKLVDTSVLGSGRDLIRCLWSLNPKTLKVCKPLFLNEFDEFDVGLIDPDWLLENLPKNMGRHTMDYKVNGSLEKIIKLLPQGTVERQAPIKAEHRTVDLLAQRINKLTKEEKEQLMRQIKNG